MPVYNFNDLTGQKFGRLTIMSRGPNTKAGKACWWCLCDCDAGVLVCAGSLQNAHTQSCGCLLTELKQKSIGNKNPAWKGGITPTNFTIRNSKKYAEWRSRVFERDNYTCQKCRTRAGYINAHHIESFNNNPELRTEVNNGITLCKTCHEDFHHQFGYTCTRQQLRIFMETGND